MPKRKPVVFDEEEERYFLKPESVSCHLFCSICQEVFTDPQRAPCGHSFCRKCITTWLRTSRTCPEDRKPVRLDQLHHDFILENIIGDQMVACSFRGAGCHFIGQLQLLASHKKNCDFNPANLPEFLKKTTSPLSTVNPVVLDGSLVLETDPVPSIGKPSLKMRLFQAGGTQKKLLTSMFDKENSNSS